MGKRAKKKVQGSPGKNSAGSRSSVGSATSNSSATPNDDVVEVEATLDRGCVHGANLDKLRIQLSKPAALQCLECAKLRSGAPHGNDKLGKGKGIKKKGHSSPVMPSVDDKSPRMKQWICLSCGHVGCGHSSIEKAEGNLLEHEKQGVVGRGHAWQHWLQLKHPQVMICGENFSCWCFQCKAAQGEHFAEKTEFERIENRDQVTAPLSRLEVLQESANLVRGKLSLDSVGLRKELLVGNSNGFSETMEKAQCQIEAVNGTADKAASGGNKRVLKGLANLGNTCFFNSVMQNLLGVDLMRNHFTSHTSVQEGPLTSSLRKFYQEASVQEELETNGSINSDTGLKKGTRTRGSWSKERTYNPKGLFGAISSKTPRFKGYQQQDSHELLMCLLDGLHTEEEEERARMSQGNDTDMEQKQEAETRADSTAAFLDKGDLTCLEDAEETRAQSAGRLEISAKGETFVEHVFGGQFSSTVRCCECGHSSVVYEPFLDLSLPIPSMQLPKKAKGDEHCATSSFVKKSQKTRAVARTKDSHTLESSNGAVELELLGSSSSCILETISTETVSLLLLRPEPQTIGTYDGMQRVDSSNMDDSSWLDFLGDSAEECELKVSAENGPVPNLQVNIRIVEIPPGFTASVEHLESIWGMQIGSSMGNGTCQPESGSDVSSVDTSSMNKLVILGAGMKSMNGEKSESNWQGSQNSLSSMNEFQGNGSEVLALKTDVKWVEDSLVSNKPRELDHVCEQPQQSFIGPQRCNNNLSTVYETDSKADSRTEELQVLCCDSELQGDFDGMASLFEEESSSGDILYNSVSSAHNGLGADQSISFEDIGQDDIYDLNQMDNGSNGDWLVSLDDFSRKELIDEEASVTMTLEGCLEIFTKSELLSGENAMGCEKCTKLLQEVSTLSQKSLYYASRKHSLKRGNVKSRDKSYPSVGQSVKGNNISISNGKEVLEKDILRVESVRDRAHSNGYCNSTARDNDSRHISNHFTDVPSRVSEFGGAETSCLCGGYDAFGEVKANGNHFTNSVLTEMSEDIADSGECGVDRFVSDQSCYQADKACLRSGMPRVEDRDVGKFVDNFDGEHLETGALSSVRCSKELAVIRSSSLGPGSSDEDGHPEEVINSVMLMNCYQAEQGDVFVAGTRDKQQSQPDDGLVGNHCISSQQALNTNPVDGQALRRRSSKRNKFPSPKISGAVSRLVKQNATKRFSISKAPPVLTIQLKRFAQDMRGQLSKLSGHVAFQESLDLDPFLDHRNGNFKGYKYRLLGTVEHSGTLKSGHYVAYVKGPATREGSNLNDMEGVPCGATASWYYISDSLVQQTTLEAVLRSDAYLLFYERCD